MTGETNGECVESPMASRELFKIRRGEDIFRVFRRRLPGYVWEQCYEVNGRGVSVTDYLQAIRHADDVALGTGGGQ